MRFIPCIFQTKDINTYDPKTLKKQSKVICQNKLLAHFCHKENNFASVILKTPPKQKYTHVIVSKNSYEILGFQAGRYFSYELKEINEI